MKYLFFIIIFSYFGCNLEEKEYLQGDPIIVSKKYSLIPGVCNYEYEGWGRKGIFEDSCDKFTVGQQLSNKEK